MAHVVLRGVRKVYPGGVIAVQGADLEIADKEFVVLVGPSGCGKSTTLRMIAGLEDLSAGEIYIGGRLVNNIAPKDRDIAMVFQSYALYPHMTVYKNLAFGLKLRKIPRQEIDLRVREAAEILGITDLLARRPKALSGGQRQRVAVGRAIVRQPQVFLFDEPLSNLDAKLRVQMRAEIIKLHQQLQSTMVYVTHDQVEAMTMGDRIVVMHEGEIQQVDTPMHVYRHPANRFVASFIGSPPMNLIEGALEAVADTLRFRAGDGTLALEPPRDCVEVLTPYAGQPVCCGIRPEDMAIAAPGTDPCWQPLEAVLEVVEPMGAETYLHFTLNGQPATARVRTETPPAVNEACALAVNTERLHFFDSETGRAIC